MRSGSLRHRLTVYRPAPPAVADDGQPILEPAAAWFSVWGQVSPIGGTERAIAQQTVADVLYRVTLRSDRLTRQITPQCWLTVAVETGRTIRLEITRIFDKDLGRKEITLDCTQRQ